jgi:hypothetical protein
MAKAKSSFTAEEAREVASKLGIDWATVEFKLECFTKGMNVELEHGLKSPETNVTNDDPVMTGKIALAHLNEFPCYYKELEEMEKDLAEDQVEEEEPEDEGEEPEEPEDQPELKAKAAGALRAQAKGTPVDIY